MKKYFNIILILSLFLLIFPFLALPELWENIYVSVFAFLIGYTSMLLRHKAGVSMEDDDASLQDYVQELKEKFNKHEKALIAENDKVKKISDISLNEK